MLHLKNARRSTKPVSTAETCAEVLPQNKYPEILLMYADIMHTIPGCYRHPVPVFYTLDPLSLPNSGGCVPTFPPVKEKKKILDTNAEIVLTLVMPKM